MALADQGLLEKDDQSLTQIVGWQLLSNPPCRPVTVLDLELHWPCLVAGACQTRKPIVARSHGRARAMNREPRWSRRNSVSNAVPMPRRWWPGITSR